MVHEFHRAMGVMSGDVRSPRMLTPDEARLRLALNLEESAELAAALGSDGEAVARINAAIASLKVDTFSFPPDLTEAADAVIDIGYINYGTADIMGLPYDDLFAEVHRSNLSKIGGTLRADGKILKPSSYQPPQILRVMVRAAARAIGRAAGDGRDVVDPALAGVDTGPDLLTRDYVTSDETEAA